MSVPQIISTKRVVGVRLLYCQMRVSVVSQQSSIWCLWLAFVSLLTMYNGAVRIRHSSHHFATQSSHSVDRAGWQAKMASVDFWIPYRNAHRLHCTPVHEIEEEKNGVVLPEFLTSAWQSFMLYSLTTAREVSFPKEHSTVWK